LILLLKQGEGVLVVLLCLILSLRSLKKVGALGGCVGRLQISCGCSGVSQLRITVTLIGCRSRHLFLRLALVLRTHGQLVMLRNHLQHFGATTRR
jgi:hypothetical protein